MVDNDPEFEQWYRNVHPRLVTTVSLAFGRTDLGQESADEAIARAFERWSKVSQMVSPEGWTYRVAMNHAKRKLRRAAFEERVAGKARSVTVAPPAGELWHVVADLPDRQRQAVVLRHVGQLKEAEIGEAMGITRGTVSATLRAAYQNLRASLEDAVTETNP